MTRILVVEDNKLNQLVALRMLDKIGFAADVAGEGGSAIAIVSARPFDLILMGCQMPGMDGYDTTRIIRERERNAGVPGTPIIGVSARANDLDREVAIEAGMDDYLTKPLRIEDLQTAVERWLGVPPVEPSADPSDFAIRAD
jgi:CheY-like chemotaxis protein